MKLGDWLKFVAVDGKAGDFPVAFRSGAYVSHSAFVTALSELTSIVAAQPAKKYLLYCDDSFNFALLLFALLCARKHVVLAPNRQGGTIESLMQHCDVCLFDDSLLDLINLDALYAPQQSITDLPEYPLLDGDTRIETDLKITIATSGSTGDIKLFDKVLDSFVQELDCLEQLWGDVIGDSQFFATVSHQHIYGLLFRLLWPLRSGRVFSAQTYPYPEPMFEELCATEKAVLVSSPAHLKRIPEGIDDGRVAEHLSFIVSSGGPLAREDAIAVGQRFASMPVEVFGSSETGGVAWRQREGDLPDPPWQAFPGVSLKLNKEGCLLVDSPYCYHQQAFEMSDQVELLDQQHFIHRGRTDRIVKLEEKRISLTAMENHLLQHPAIKEARVILLDAKAGRSKRQQLGAVVVLSEPQDLSDNASRRTLNDQFREHLLSHVERSLLPRKWRYPSELPINAQGKVTQEALMHLFDKHDISQLPAALQHDVLQHDEECIRVQIDMGSYPEYFEGHFPAIAILPGVMQLHWVVGLAKKYWFHGGHFRSASRIKFQAAIRPQHKIEIRLHNHGDGKVSYEYRTDQQSMSSGIFHWDLSAGQKIAP